ncbi:uncharacterized protein LOC115150419 isoform X2 [Salmo trutta]|uniref:uncharacterized protein LOC115150419 isoform X2 n=1 Tax=Salmo trutta TaxID=8032 RepID=UPI001131842D|nr:uncharacterized protein LOC115150419 isoform X2 [Salmo trutta]
MWEMPTFSCVIGVNGPIGSINKIGKTESFDGDQKHWSYNEQGYISFREVSTPYNIPPENKAKMTGAVQLLRTQMRLRRSLKMLVDPTCYTWVLVT